jgi:hypothetical protein
MPSPPRFWREACASRADECQRWTERWERDAGEVMAAEEVLAQEVAARIGGRLASNAQDTIGDAGAPPRRG